jgi:hypothetical protein
MRSIFLALSAILLAGCDVKIPASIDAKPAQASQANPKQPISKLDEERQRNMELANSSPVEQQQKQLVIKDSELNSVNQSTSNEVLPDNKVVTCQDYSMSFIDKDGNTLSTQKLGPSRAPDVALSNAYNIMISNKVLKAAYPNQSNSDIAFNGAMFVKDTSNKDSIGVMFKKISSDGTNELIILSRKPNNEYIFIASTVFDPRSPRIMQMKGICN